MATRASRRIAAVGMTAAAFVFLLVAQATVAGSSRKCIQECDVKLQACQEACAFSCSGYEETCYLPCTADCLVDWDECAVDAMNCSYGGLYSCIAYAETQNGVLVYLYTDCLAVY